MNAIALVIGNNSYSEEHNRLIRAVKDAECVAEKMLRLGFKVSLETDSTVENFDRRLQEFEKDSKNYEVALFYYSGHGLEIEGQNYLTGVDTSFVDSTSAKHTSIPLTEVIDRMRSKSLKIKILILDACRNNPLPDRGINKGLAPVNAPRGTIIAFSTSPGESAMDYGGGENSIYTAAFLKHIEDANIPIEEFFKRVRTTVYTLSNGKQTSWEHTSLIGDFCFNAGQMVHASNLPYANSVVLDSTWQSFGSNVDKIIERLRSHDWYRQSPAFQDFQQLTPIQVTSDEKFLLGRNLLQTADGGEWKTVEWFENLGGNLRRWTQSGKNHILNGILFEIYFNSQGMFRRNMIKSGMLDKVCALESMKEYADSFEFIKEQLLPFRDFLYYIPSTNPKSLPVEALIEDVEYEGIGGKKKIAPTLTKLCINGRDILAEEDEDIMRRTLNFEDLEKRLAVELAVPKARLTLSVNRKVEQVKVPWDKLVR